MIGIRMGSASDLPTLRHGAEGHRSGAEDAGLLPAWVLTLDLAEGLDRRTPSTTTLEPGEPRIALLCRAGSDAS